MARTTRPVRSMPQYPGVDELGPGVDGAQSQAQWVPMCWPPQGMNCSDTPHALAPGQPRWAINMVPWPDSWRTRFPVAYVGGSYGGPPWYVAESTTTIVAARQVVDALGNEWIIRWSTTGVQILVGATWTDCTGPTLGLNKYGKVAMTGWGTKLIFSDATTGMYALDMSSLTYTLLTGAPNAQHLTTFNRRVIASVPSSSRVQWCVAGDYTDWTSTNLGAGYEDLLSAPGGGVDSQTAVLPVSDEVAYVVRSNSIWQMEPTRNVDAPFAFSRVLAELGSRWPATCITIPGGIAFMGDRGVYLFRGGQVEDIASPIRNQFIGTAQSVLRSATMCYDPIGEGLRLAGDWNFDSTINVGGASLTARNLVWRWHFRIGGGWTCDSWESGQRVRSVSNTLDFRKRSTIGELSGTVGALTGVIGDLGVSGYQSGVLYVMYNTLASGGTTNWVGREAPDVQVSPPSAGAYETYGDTNGLYDMVPLPSGYLESGAICGSDPRHASLHQISLVGANVAAGLSFYAYGFDTYRNALSGANQFETLGYHIIPTGAATSPYPYLFDWKFAGHNPRIQLTLSAVAGITVTHLQARVTLGALMATT